MKRLRGIILALLVVAGNGAHALIETYEFSDPALEERYYALTQELRCPKCQNQNIADSNAPIAEDLRRTLHEQLEQGATDGEIRDYMVARYGEFVRYRPRFGGITAVLWLAPVLLLLAGAGVLFAILRSRARDGGAGGKAARLSAEEEAKVRSLLDKVERDS
jgi:cytochrome c-type biogenesis protein CcmH